MKTFFSLRVLLVAILMTTLTLTSFAQLTTNNGYIHLRQQHLYGNNAASLTWKSNHSTSTQITLTDKEQTNYGRVYGGANGANFGLLDGDGNWSYLAAKDNYTAFRINNSEKMRIKSNGNVGVGTANPDGKLTVVSSNNQRGLESLNPQGNSHFPWSNGWSYLSGLGIVFRTNGDTERMRIATNGYVGIGTAAPSQKLHVVGAARFSNSSNVGEYIEMNHGGYNAYINAVGDGNIDFRHDNQTKMSIAGNGWLGIGTPTPAFPVHLATSGTNWATIGLDAPGSNGNKWLLRSRADNREFDIRSAETGVDVLTLKPDGDMHIMGDVYANGIKLGTSGSGFDPDNVPTIKVNATSGDDVIRMRRADRPNEEFVFKYGYDSHAVLVKRNWSGGNVSSEPVIMRFGEVGGIPNVNTKVEFPNGKIYCTEIEVNVAGQGDFVFEDEYDLKDLEEVESFIEENGHLPEIPKAPETGLAKWNVGEMSNKLLIKIEELTLYTIEQQKEIEAKDKQYKELLERLESIEQELDK